MLKNIKTAGELQESRFVTGEIISLDHYLDSCDISVDGASYSDVPIFYHCDPDATENSSGAINGGSWGFAVGDDVVVLLQKNKQFVIGHKAGARPCVPMLIIYASDSGSEAIIWDILHDEIVSPSIGTLSSVQSELDNWGITEQTECVPEDLREYSFTGSLLTPFIQHEPDLPYYDAPINEYPPFVSGSLPSARLLDYEDNIWTPSDRQFSQTYYTNPVSSKDQTPRPGMWAADISGVIPRNNWDSAWGDCPFDYGQSWQVDPSTGTVSVRHNVEQIYLFFRSIFDIKLNAGSSTSTSLSVSNLSWYTDLIYQLTVDGEYFYIEDIDINTWLAAGLLQSSYDRFVDLTEDGLDPECGPAYHLLLPHLPMWDKATGMATNDDSTLLFEHFSVYPNKYGFYEAEETWDSDMVAKLNQAFRIYYRHPFLKKNADAVLFEKVNDIRVDLSLDPLEINHNLYAAAQVFSDDMAKRMDVEPLHIGSDGSEPHNRAEDVNYILGMHTSSINSYAVGENVLSHPMGLTWQIERSVDNSDINIPESYLSEVTDLNVRIAQNDVQISHDTEGELIGVKSVGWKQSPGHYEILSHPLLTETGLATQFGKNSGFDGYTYATQVFGVIGNPNDFTDQTNQKWPGFSCFDTTKLLEYVNDNFVFAKSNGDERRIPKIYLCTFPQ